MLNIEYSMCNMENDRALSVILLYIAKNKKR